MHDQADELRQLVRRGGLAAPAAADRPRLVAVCGSQPGVGATSVALNVSIALARAARRVVYVDAGPQSAFAAMSPSQPQAGNSPVDPLADVLDGRRRLHDVLAPGPGGICVVRNVWKAMGQTAVQIADLQNAEFQSAERHSAECHRTVQQRLISEFKGLGRRADAVVLDAGCGANLAVRRFCQSADIVLVVTTTDTGSVMEAYAVLKVIAAGDDFERVSIVVNRAADPLAGKAVHERLAEVCKRLLGWRPAASGCVLADPALPACGVQRPILLHSPDSPAARGFQQVAESFLNAIPAPFETPTRARSSSRAKPAAAAPFAASAASNDFRCQDRSSEYR